MNAVATTRLVFGAASLGNLHEAMSDTEAASLLDAAWECGIRAFDTAPHYGLGLSEKRLGAYLAAKPRAEFTVSTKVGRLLVPNPDFAGGSDRANDFLVPDALMRQWDPSEGGIRRSLAESLDRMGLDRVDTLYLHDPDRHPQVEQALDSGLTALGRLREEGVAAEVGVGSMSGSTLERAVQHPQTTQVMCAGPFTLLDTEAGVTLLPQARRADVKVVIAAVYASGLLARTTVQPGRYLYESAPDAVLERARRIASVCADHGTDLPTAAVQFVLRHPAVTQVTLGAHTAEQLRQSVQRVHTEVPVELWDELEDAGLIVRPSGTVGPS